jgi:hypothetical protein
VPSGEYIPPVAQHLLYDGTLKEGRFCWCFLGYRDNHDMESICLNYNGWIVKKGSQDYTGWPTKAEAAELLGMSEKTIERLATRGEIQQAYRRIPNRRPTPVFNPADIETLKGQTASGKAFVVPESAANAAPES